MKNVCVTAFPYAVQYGDIKVPDNLKDNEIKQYIQDHWNDIKFGKPDLDYCGTDFEIDC